MNQNGSAADIKTMMHAEGANEKALLVKMLKKLSAELGRTPDIYDWVIATDKRWWDYFASWSRFLEQADLAARRTVVLPEPGEDKLVTVLNILESRAKRPITKDEWYRLIDGNKTEKQIPSFHKYYGLFVTNARQWRRRWDAESYLADTNYFDCHRKPSIGSWLSFRYAAGLQSYTPEELISMGVDRLKVLRGISLDEVRVKSEYGTKIYSLYFEGLKYTSHKEIIIPQDETSLMDSGIMMAIFCSPLPHLAIYDNFRTIRNYIEAVFREDQRGEYTRGPEDILLSIKYLAKELTDKTGMRVKIEIIP